MNSDEALSRYAIVFEKYDEETKKIHFTAKEADQAEHDEIDELRRFALEVQAPDRTLLNSAR